MGFKRIACDVATYQRQLEITVKYRELTESRDVNHWMVIQWHKGESFALGQVVPWFDSRWGPRCLLPQRGPILKRNCCFQIFGGLVTKISLLYKLLKFPQIPYRNSFRIRCMKTKKIIQPSITIELYRWKHWIWMSCRDKLN